MSATPHGQITVYPANRLEDLAVLLERVLRLNPGAALSRSTVIVESRGMQHWVSMALAESRGLCMNVDFPFPGAFIWQLVRRLLGEARVPLESPYQREALAWRIDRLLAASAIIEDARFADVTDYWRTQTANGQVHIDPLKRFQLAARQADLFEQYLLFRPDWIDAWQQARVPSGLTDNWQAHLWRALVAENPDHPLRLQQQASEILNEQSDKLPHQVCLFAINTLPPATLQFFDLLARHTQVHLFHLNPCVAYWGDLQSEKHLAAQRAEQARRWLAMRDPEQVASRSAALDNRSAEVGNPLLANLGGQGREFFAALQQLQTFEISAFDLPPTGSGETATELTVLQKVQGDILNLLDARQEPAAQVDIDGSISFSACHSALRELQVLHDWLLHRFNDDDSLTPRDVLVMCPQVERYAPYIGAVFDSGFFTARAETNGAQQPPRLPVSITDRAPRDAEPLISGFLELLTLPDSRFQVSKVLDLLRLPSLQARFGFAVDELSTLEWWLSEACIHWGLDAEHKARVIGSETASELFSWGWGLRRLLLGFARSDRAELVDHQWLLPHVEGSDALLLGRLMQLLERMQQHAIALRQRRIPAQWGVYLRELGDAFFSTAARGDGGDERDARDELDKSINQLVSWADLVDYREPLELEVVRFYLNRHLAMPDDSNRFMTGQITFCSLEPMRNAPFRVIAILGLNDGEYPRQQVPVDFDLMAQTPRRAGDRSRRGDDRYLFLEAFVCAREKLYLSYQGADIKNDCERQPSLILTELMDYLQRGYGWNFEAGGQLQRQPLQPFSPANFNGSEPGFDRRWQALGRARDSRDNRICLDPPAVLLNSNGLEELALESLVRFYDNPPRAFAEQRLGLRLREDGVTLDDAEPFDADGLTAFQGRERLLQALLSGEQSTAQARQELAASGRLPDSYVSVQLLDRWQQQTEMLAEGVKSAAFETLQSIPVSLSLEGVSLSAVLPVVADEEARRLLLWRPALIKPKDQWRLWLYHLLAQACGEVSLAEGVFLAKDRKTNALTVVHKRLDPVADPLDKLAHLIAVWRSGLCQPVLLNASLGLTVCEKQYQLRGGVATLQPPEKRVAARNKAWNEAWAEGPFTSAFSTGEDPYVRWFWPQGDSLDNWWPRLQEIYASATAALLGAET